MAEVTYTVGPGGISGGRVDTHTNILPIQDGLTIGLVNLQFQPQVSDSLSFSDLFTFQIGGAALGILLPVEDFLLLDSSVALLENFLEDEFIDNLLITDFPSVFLVCFLAFSETLSLSDIVQMILGSSQFTDTFSMGDTIQMSLTGTKPESVSDSMALNDTVSIALNGSLVGYLRRYLNDVK